MISPPQVASGLAPDAAVIIERTIISDLNDSRIDIKLLKGLVRLMKGGDVTELEVDDAEKGLRIRLKRGNGVESVVVPTVQVVSGAAPAVVAAAPAEAASAAEDEVADVDDERSIPSPMVGTFYRSSSPEVDPFVRVGDRVEEGTVVCILEAMKVMNEIQAETSGEIAEVLVENGEPVEFGQPLFLLR